MTKKYGLTKREQKLLEKAQFYQEKAGEYHRKFAAALEARFPCSNTVRYFEEWDLWILNESGDSSGTEQEAHFWQKVRNESR